jgi:SNF2 family DNA or RNA helicase
VVCKFTDRTTVRIVGTPKVRRRQWEEARGVDFVFLNYELAINDLDSTFIHGMLSDYRCALVLDEATRIKNFRAKRTREFSKFSAVVKILLTGTPLENRPGELYTLVSFLDNHILGSWNSFDYEYIKRNAKGWVVGYRNLAGLHDRVSPIMLRRRKQEVMPELPSKIVNEYPVEMSKEEMSDYNAIKNRVVEHVQKMERAHEAGDRSEFNVEQMAFFQSIQFLKMYCDHPDLVRMTESRIMEGLELKATRSSKLEELKFIVDEMVSSGNKVVVFTEFARAAELISREIPDVIVYRGGLSEREKKDRIDRFVDPGSGAMVLCSTDAGSHGLNLQEAASYLVNYDLPWNPSVLNQRIDRIHRIGQENTVNIINMVIVDDGVIEETIRKVLGRKQKLFDAVIEGTGG